MADHDIHAHMYPGMRIIFPFGEGATWGDLRELSSLGNHYSDDQRLEWNRTESRNLDGVIIRREGDN